MKVGSFRVISYREWGRVVCRLTQN